MTKSVEELLQMTEKVIRSVDTEERAELNWDGVPRTNYQYISWVGQEDGNYFLECHWVEKVGENCFICPSDIRGDEGTMVPKWYTIEIVGTKEMVDFGGRVV